MPPAGGQRRADTLGDHRPLLLGQGCIDVQHERVHVGTELSHQDRHPLGHQLGDEVDDALQPVELVHQHLTAVAPLGGQRRGELQPKASDSLQASTPVYASTTFMLFWAANWAQRSR